MLHAQSSPGLRRLLFAWEEEVFELRKESGFIRKDEVLPFLEELLRKRVALMEEEGNDFPFADVFKV